MNSGGGVHSQPNSCWSLKTSTIQTDTVSPAAVQERTQSMMLLKAPPAASSMNLRSASRFRKPLGYDRCG